MHVIVGLGNPGEKYTNSRHNAGWLVLFAVIAKSGLPKPVPAARYAGEISEGTLAGKDVLLLFPTTFMNKSGSAVKKVLPQKEADEHLIVIYDDVDLPIGDLKISFGRGSGGHNGLQSVIEAVGTKDFARIRIGIAPKSIFGAIKRPKGERLSEHVLGELTRRERKKIEEVAERAHRALEVIIHSGVEKAMQEFN